MTLLHLLSFVAAVGAFLFVTLSLASGLLWLSELIEEHSKFAKVVGKKCIFVIISIHVLLAFTDSLPPHKIAFSILCHITYLQNFSDSWPVIPLSSLSFVASCILVVVDHFMWFFHFAHVTHDARQVAHKAYHSGPVVKAPSFGDMATFFGICVWLTPLFLFLSLSANDNTLPTTGTLDTMNSPSIAASSFPPTMQRSRSLLPRLLFGFIPGLRRSSSRSAEGIIAPMSPVVPLSPSHGHPLSPLTPSRSSSFSEIGESTSTWAIPEFSLNRPPPRRVSPHTLTSHPVARRRGSDM